MVPFITNSATYTTLQDLFVYHYILGVRCQQTETVAVPTLSQVGVLSHIHADEGLPVLRIPYEDRLAPEFSDRRSLLEPHGDREDLWAERAEVPIVRDFC